MSPTVPQAARALAAQLKRGFARDAESVQQLNDAHQRLSQADDQLWSGIHPDGLATIYAHHPAIAKALADPRSDVLEGPDPLAAVGHVRWTIATAFTDYLSAAEERRRLAADIGETIRRLVDELAPPAGSRPKHATPTSISWHTTPLRKPRAERNAATPTDAPGSSCTTPSSAGTAPPSSSPPPAGNRTQPSAATCTSRSPNGAAGGVAHEPRPNPPPPPALFLTKILSAPNTIRDQTDQRRQLAGHSPAATA